MLSLIRSLVVTGLALATVGFTLMAIIGPFRYTKHGAITKKTIRVGALYMELAAVSAGIALMVLNPAYTTIAVLGIAAGSVFVLLYLLSGYFGVRHAEKMWPCRTSEPLKERKGNEIPR